MDYDTDRYSRARAYLRTAQIADTTYDERHEFAIWYAQSDRRSPRAAWKDYKAQVLS
jgi:hypothetical protein